MISQLQEQTRQMTDAISLCDIALQAGDASNVAETSLRISPEFRESQYTKVGMNHEDCIPIVHQNGFGKGNDPFRNQNSSINSIGAFQDDPFKAGL